ncbi:tetratricopeptide repeat protein [Acidobacteriota bacterium]
MKSPKKWGIPLALTIAAAMVIVLGTSFQAVADYKIGMQHYKAGKYEAALAEFQKQIDMSPTWHFSKYMAGICLLKLKKLDQASAMLEQAMVDAENDKDRFKTLDVLGKVYKAKRNYDKAVEKFETAAGLQVPAKMKGKAHEQAGDVHLKTKKFKEAEKSFGQAATLNSDDKDLQYKLGIVRMRTGNYDGAVAALEKAHMLNSKDLKWMERLGDAYLARALRTKDANKKREYYGKGLSLAKKGLSINPGSFTMNELLGNSYLGLQDYEQAIQVLTKAVSMKPDYGHAYYNLAQACAAKKDYSEAERCLMKARDLMPKDAAVFTSLGFVYEKQKRLDESKQAYNTAYNLKPSNFNKKNLARVQKNIDIRDQNLAIEQDNVKIEKLNELISLENQRIEMENVEAERINEIIEQEFGDEEKENKDKDK